MWHLYNVCLSISFFFLCLFGSIYVRAVVDTLVEINVWFTFKWNCLRTVMHVIVKYSAVTYMVFLLGPLMISGVFVSFIHTYEYGLCVTFANFHSQLYWTCLQTRNKNNKNCTEKTLSRYRESVYICLESHWY